MLHKLKLVEKIFKCPVSCISWFILYIHGQHTNFHLFDYLYKLCVYVLPLLFHIVKYDRVIIDASAKTNDFEIHDMNVCSCHRSGNWRNGGGSYVPEWSLSYEWSLKGTKNVPRFVFQKASAGFVHVATYLLRIDWKIAIIAVSWPFVRNEMETFCIPFQLRRWWSLNIKLRGFCSVSYSRILLLRRGYNNTSNCSLSYGYYYL